MVGEILHVIDQNATPTSDGLSCMQAIFSLLDVLNLWSEDQRFPENFDWGILEAMMADIPRVKLAHAASTCGAHARYVSADVGPTDFDGRTTPSIVSISTLFTYDRHIARLSQGSPVLRDPPAYEG